MKYYDGPPPKHYICDRMKCKNCVPQCKYTRDISHAKNYDWEFELRPSGLYEKEKKKTE